MTLLTGQDNIEGKILCFPEIRNSKKFKELLSLLENDKIAEFIKAIKPYGNAKVVRHKEISKNWVMIDFAIDFTYDLDVFFTLLSNLNKKYKFMLHPRNPEERWNDKTPIL